jgi:hypothetical protein
MRITNIGGGWKSVNLYLFTDTSKGYREVSARTINKLPS